MAFGIRKTALRDIAITQAKDLIEHPTYLGRNPPDIEQTMKSA